MDQYKTPEHDKALVGVLLAAGGFGNSPIVSSPGIPADQIKILREAFNRTLRDQGFLEEAKKRSWEIRPVKGEELESFANEVTTQSSQIIESLKKFLGK
jgi:tripartite-type tricarboxylate transporter receptor subunit TctC